MRNAGSRYTFACLSDYVAVNRYLYYAMGKVKQERVQVLCMAKDCISLKRRYSKLVCSVGLYLCSIQSYVVKCFSNRYRNARIHFRTVQLLVCLSISLVQSFVSLFQLLPKKWIMDEAIGIRKFGSVAMKLEIPTIHSYFFGCKCFQGRLSVTNTWGPNPLC